jgi:hypothetical protein
VSAPDDARVVDMQPEPLNIAMHKALNSYALGDWDGGDMAKQALASAGIAIEPRASASNVGEHTAVNNAAPAGVPTIVNSPNAVPPVVQEQPVTRESFDVVVKAAREFIEAWDNSDFEHQRVARNFLSGLIEARPDSAPKMPCPECAGFGDVAGGKARCPVCAPKVSLPPCHSCHRDFAGERRFRMTPHATGPRPLPEFCEKCAPRIGLGVLEEVTSEERVP